MAKVARIRRWKAVVGSETSVSRRCLVQSRRRASGRCRSKHLSRTAHPKRHKTHTTSCTRCDAHRQCSRSHESVSWTPEHVEGDAAVSRHLSQRRAWPRLASGEMLKAWPARGAPRTRQPHNKGQAEVAQPATNERRPQQSGAQAHLAQAQRKQSSAVSVLKFARS